MDVRAEMLVFSRISTALTEVLGRDIRANGPRMSAGCPSQKLPLWADFSFLREANLAIFHRKTHRNRNRIVTAKTIASWKLDKLVGTTSNYSM